MLQPFPPPPYSLEVLFSICSRSEKNRIHLLQYKIGQKQQKVVSFCQSWRLGSCCCGLEVVKPGSCGQGSPHNKQLRLYFEGNSSFVDHLCLFCNFTPAVRELSRELADGRVGSVEAPLPLIRARSGRRLCTSRSYCRAWVQPMGTAVSRAVQRSAAQAPLHVVMATRRRRAGRAQRRRAGRQSRSSCAERGHRGQS